jgi:glucose-1-phosphatase
MDFSKDSVKVLLFDLGGVVIKVSFAKVLETWAALSGADSAVLKTRFTFDLPYEQHECNEITGSEYFDSLRKSLGIQLTDEQFEKGWNALALGEVPGIKSLLLSAKQHFPVYAFSNINVTHSKYFFSTYTDVLGIFEKVFTSCELRKRKPTREAFEVVAKEIGVSPEEILFFDDLLENVEGARLAGLQAVQIKDIEDTKKALEYLGVIS